jgi:hypothetical protein
MMTYERFLFVFLLTTMLRDLLASHRTLPDAASVNLQHLTRHRVLQPRCFISPFMTPFHLHHQHHEWQRGADGSHR